MFPLGQVTTEQELIAIFKREAQTEIEHIMGQAYELIPASVRRQFERTYIERRLAEERERLGVAAVDVGKKLLPLIAGGLALLLVPKKGR